MTGRVVCFGEVLLRLSAPDDERLLQSPRLAVHIGGAEANVAVNLARLGREAAMVGALPDNGFGRAARDELRRHGVDTSGLSWGDGRMGIYVLEPGALWRPSEILYDRAHSAFALDPPERIDWDVALAGAAWLHLSGITPALGPGPAKAAIRAAQAARRLGVGVTFDGNYRAKLWAQWDSDPKSILHELFALADLAFAEDRDLAMVLGRGFEGDFEARQAAAAEAAFQAFPNLKTIACTHRRQHDVDSHELSAVCRWRGGGARARTYALSGIVDRIGAGDAFAAGFLHRRLAGGSPAEALEFGLAAAALKHSIPGDFNLVSEAEVQALVAGEGLQPRR